jgi:hypothetical protein
MIPYGATEARFQRGQGVVAVSIVYITARCRSAPPHLRGTQASPQNHLHKDVKYLDTHLSEFPIAHNTFVTF